MMYARTIEINGKSIEYSLRKRRKQKTFTLAVYRNGKVVLTVPYMTSLTRAERYITEKRTWLSNIFTDHALPVQGTTEARRAEYRKHKERARALVHARLTELNGVYKFRYNRVSIRLNSSRWGSCSERKNLNFDYRILFLPHHLQEYLVVHELCHIMEMNHSKRFWELVARTVPDYCERRKELKKIVL